MLMSIKEDLILFHNEDVDFELNNSLQLKQWIGQAILAENQECGALNFVFCSDDYLHALNIEFLDHDTLTDIITFPSGEDNISGDIFISIDRVKENALTYKVDFGNELSRVIIHGVLHLCGFGDKSAEESKIMREKEDHYLAVLNTP